MRINDWADYITRWRVGKGFVTGKGNALDKLMLVVTEVTEALAALEAGDRDNYAEELADIQIRILDLAAACGVDMECRLNFGEPAEPMTFADAALERFPYAHFQPDDENVYQDMMDIVRYLSNTAEAVRRAEWDEFEAGLVGAFRQTSAVAAYHAIELEKEVAGKMKVNETRPHLHGKLA